MIKQDRTYYVKNPCPRCGSKDTNCHMYGSRCYSCKAWSDFYWSDTEEKILQEFTIEIKK